MNLEKSKSRVEHAVLLSKYISGYYIYLTMAILCNLIFKILPLGISFLSSLMVSLVVLKEIQMIPVMLLTIGILVVLDAIFSYLDILVSHDMTYRILTKLRDMTYDKISELAPANMVGNQSGDFISIIIDDVELLEWFYAHVIAQLIVAVVIPVTMLLFLGHFSIWLPVVIVPFIILLIAVPKLEEQKANKQGSIVRKFAGKLNAEIIDGVQGLKDILSFGWQRKYFERFSDAEKDYRKANFDYEARSAKDSSIMNLIVELAGLSADIATVVLVKNQVIDMKYMLPIFLMSVGIFAPIMEALTMSNNYGLIFGAAERVVKLLEKKSIVCDTGDKTAIDIMNKGYNGEHDLTSINSHDSDESTDSMEFKMIQFQNVSFRYPNEEGEKENLPILHNVSFSVKRGETVALVGASGSGKTTISRLLLRFWDVDKGNITINNTNIKDIKISELQKLVTVVPQESYLFATSIEDNIRLAKNDASDEELQKAASLAQADVFIQEFPDAYQTMLGEHGLRLSGGEKKRIAISQAVLKNAPILVLDESSANLDAENERLINKAIKSLKAGKATLMIAHRLSTIRSADRIIFIKDGSVLAEGTYKDMVDNCIDFRKLIGEAV